MSIRNYSELIHEKEQADFANRKSKIKEDHKKYYPTLKEARDEYGQDFKLLRIPDFRSKFETFEWPTAKRIDELYVVEGKIHSVRKSGKGMIFVDVMQDFTKVQLVVMNKLTGLDKEKFFEVHEFFKRGDFITAIGYPGITNAGELSLKCTQPLKLVSPALHPLPPKLTDNRKRNHNKVVDYLVNEDSRDRIIARSMITSSIRKFLSSRGFLEVSTPIIASSTKGANATPFVTHSQHIKNSKNELVDLQLRVAPELWLKKLIIGGFDKVFEIGSSFRNEGIDGTHNPEFTTCEFYQSYIELNDLMVLTEDLFKDIFQDLKGLEICKEHIKSLEEAGTFKKLEFIPTVERETGVKFPDEITQESLLSYFTAINLPLPKIKSSPQLLDTLSATFLEPLCTTPTFIYHQPSIMAPLAKSVDLAYDTRTFNVSKRFELFIKGKEYVNAYEEENSPFDQESKFKQQQEFKEEFNDEDTIVPDHLYLSSMEWGMPSVGGWGLGVDRLCMLLCGRERIEDVLTFGTLPDVLKQ
jgi:lysyl-tRNA synthetase class 2